MALFLPTYFAPIAQYAAIVNADEVLFEVEDNFQKQTKWKATTQHPYTAHKQNGKVKNKRYSSRKFLATTTFKIHSNCLQKFSFFRVL